MMGQRGPWPIGFVFLILTAALRSTWAQSLCHTDSIHQKLLELQQLSAEENLAAIADTTDLDRVCSRMKILIGNVTTYMNECIPKDYREIMLKTLDGTSEVTRNLCDDALFRRRYLSHSACFQGVKAKFSKCGEEYNNIVRIKLANTAPDNEETLSRRMTSACCAYEQYATCSYGEASAACGNDAAEFMRDFLNTAVGHAIKDQCDSGRMCSAGDSTVGLNAKVLLMLIALLLAIV